MSLQNYSLISTSAVYYSQNMLLKKKKKDDTSDLCFESTWLNIKCYSISQLHIYRYYNYYLIIVRQYFAIWQTKIMRYVME